MKLSKKKVFALALVVCLIATLSLGSLAWFTDDDSVTNDFLVAGSDKEDPDEIFSVEVWEEGDDEEKGLQYDKILPGDTRDKIAHVKNTGSYDQYIRVKITVTDAHIWQETYKANMIPVTEFVNVDLSAVYEGKVGSYLDEENDSFVYYLYYNAPLTLDDPETEDVDESDMIVFTETYVCEHLDQYQAARFLEDEVPGYQISVQADAVQTANVCTDDDDSNDVYEAFRTVGMEIPVNTAYAGSREEVVEAFANNKYIVLNANITNMNAAHKINGTDVELYLNDYTLETASGAWQGEYGMKIDGELAVSGYGTLRAGTLKIQVGSLTVYGGTLTSRNADGFVDSNEDPIVLP